MVLTGIPKGYSVAESYGFQGGSCSITLASKVITDDTSLSGVSYKAGDIMRDFTVTTTDGETFTLSEVLKTKKAVLINFWFSTCGPCASEFPYMNSAYEQFKDDIEIIALNHYGADTEETIRAYKETYELTFPVAKDNTSLGIAFNVTAYPTSILVDRYGMISLIEAGAIVSEAPFTHAFTHFSADEYKQTIFKSIGDLIPTVTPTQPMPPSDEVAGVLNGSEMDVVYHPETDESAAEHTWPFLIGEKDGVDCLYASNKEVDSSFAILYATIQLKKDDVVAVDFFISSEEGGDLLYIFVDDKDIYQASGESETWSTCYPFVALEDGEYELAFCYLKDDSITEGDDTVYIKNLRIVTLDDIDTEVYIPRFCATDLSEDKFTYGSYSEVFYNETDGYYHVGSVNGPLLIADLLKATRFSSDPIMSLAYAGKVELDGKNYYDDLLPFFTAASNSVVYGLCTVNQELYELLHIVSQAVGLDPDKDHEWLQMCLYYDAYGTDGKQYPDPIAGLTNYSAFPTVSGEGNLNKVTYTRIIMPRGLKYKFVPTVSGAYRITSISEIDVDGWVFDAEENELCVYDNMNGGSPRTDADLVNVNMMIYLEAGVDYYIDIAYDDPYQEGTFYFEVIYLGETFEYLTMASPGPFTFEETEDTDIINRPIALGINVTLDEDGFYHELRADGSIGSIVYADFTKPTHIFTSQSMEQLLEMGGFDFSKTETDQQALRYLEQYGDDYEEELRALWGEDFEENMELYQIEDVRQGIYHGRGEDYTDALRTYLSKTENDPNKPELIGCVAVDEQLAEILQMLMDKYTFEDVENSWIKLCYYYKLLAPMGGKD